MMRWLLLSMLLVQAGGSAPQTFVARFYTAYIKHHAGGFFLEGHAKRTLNPLLSKRLRRLLDDKAACQKDWVRQQPKGSTDKPPFVDCCASAGSADGMPTSFAVGPAKALPDGRYYLAVDFVRKESADVIKWRDAVIVIKDGARFAVDDVIADADTSSSDTARLSERLFQGCQGRHWIGGLQGVAEPSISAQTSPRVEATSLGGQPLVAPVDIPNRARLESGLARAEQDLSARPNDADAIIWVGRRQAYLWRFQDAIATFAKGIAAHPANPKLLRHRGHRYITVRQFDRAIADLEKAAGLIRGTADEVEPDGAPNPSGKPRSTLHFNIWYHLGLAHYLTGNYSGALDAYAECMKVSTNDDAIVATSDWMWMTLMRLGRKADAAKLLERISPKMEILESGSYHRRLLMYKGIEKPEALLDPGNADDLAIATQGYGVGNYFDVSGDRTRARQIFAKVVSGRQWSAFGFIAAEADLQRMK